MVDLLVLFVSTCPVIGINFTLQGSAKTKEELKSLERQIAERHKKHKEDRKGSGGL